jgi:hypothetical protein
MLKRFGLVLLLLSGCTGTPPPSAAKSPETDALVGAWRSSIQFSEGTFTAIKDLEILYVFNAGNTMTESSNYAGAPPVPPAYEIWRWTGPNRFEATYTLYNTKAPAHFDDLAQGGGWLPAGRGVQTERLTLANDGRSFESAIDLVQYDQAGKRVDGGSHATGHGTRVHF